MAFKNFYGEENFEKEIYFKKLIKYFYNDSSSISNHEKNCSQFCFRFEQKID